MIVTFAKLNDTTKPDFIYIGMDESGGIWEYRKTYRHGFLSNNYLKRHHIPMRRKSPKDGHAGIRFM